MTGLTSGESLADRGRKKTGQSLGRFFMLRF